MKSLFHGKYLMITPRRSPMFFDGDYGVFREENFMEMLAFEQRRSDRSGTPFLLMTLTLSGISDLQNRRDTIRGGVEAISGFGRDTDIKGWYRRASVLGVIFTETDNAESETLREKIYRRLRAYLTDAQVDAIQISFRRYPDDGISAISGSPENFALHADRLEKEQSQNFAFSTK
jgi:hypothetical protein